MSRFFRRASALPVLAFVVATSALAVAAPPAVADDANTLTVVGTSDVFDSNLVQSVIKPGFEAAYPGVTLNYVSKGTGAAIAYAEAGSASALIVHAASLENQFVDQGYSAEQYGRAIFYGDYVLVGPANDPAHVLTGTANDIVGAFEKIATVGAKGKANFVSRGGTPGTTVQEHAIWALTNGVPVCTVSDTNGGGEAPSTVGGNCPSVPTNPSWYHTTGLTQGPNIVNGDACNYSGGGCYVFTDRGTFQYLQSQNSIANLGIKVKGNGGGKRGGSTVLVNSFHAYAINAAKFAGSPNVQINSAGALNLLNWITSPAAQSAIGAYLANAEGGAPFIPDATPKIVTSALPTSVPGGTAVVVKGTISNRVPGTPALNGVPVTLTFTPTAAPLQTATVTATTNANGGFALSYKPAAAGSYTVSTSTIAKVEDDELMPVFGDILAGVATPSLGTVPVNGAVTGLTLTPGKGVLAVSAALAPAVKYNPGTVDIYAALVTDPPTELSKVGSVTIPVNGARVNTRVTLPAGKYQVQLHYINDGVIVEGLSAVSAAVTVR